jgi:heme-degrading monooxygenase HmoA
MFAVIFVVQPKEDRFDDYLGLAKLLKPELEKIEGFIDNERFGSQRGDARLLSLSTWRDEKALIRWRTLAVHHEVQKQGRFEVFHDYNLRVGEIVADTAIPEGQVLQDMRFDETAAGSAKALTISEMPPARGEAASADLAGKLGLPGDGKDGVIGREVFESIYNPGKFLLLALWKDLASARHWEPRAGKDAQLRHRTIRVIRDYGMFDRREAPQYYRPVEETGG